MNSLLTKKNYTATKGAFVKLHKSEFVPNVLNTEPKTEWLHSTQVKRERYIFIIEPAFEIQKVGQGIKKIIALLNKVLP